MPHRPLFTNKTLAYLALALGLLLLTGSFIDYPFSRAVVNPESFFANFFAGFGAFPASLGAVGGGLLLILGHRRRPSAAKIAEIVVGVIAMILGAWLTYTTPPKYTPWNKSWLALISVAAILITLIFTYWLQRKGVRRATVRNVGWVLIATILTELIVINVLKGIWERPRMRFIAERPEDLFHHWWQVGNELKELFLPQGIPADEFKSFPSGHTGHATLMMSLALMPRLKLNWRRYQNRLLGLGIAWAGLTALSRVIIGAHFLTDTVIGFAVGLVSLWFFDRLIFKQD